MYFGILHILTFVRRVCEYIMKNRRFYNMLRDDFDLRLTNELIETYLKIAYGINRDAGLMLKKVFFRKIRSILS